MASGFFERRNQSKSFQYTNFGNVDSFSYPAHSAPFLVTYSISFSPDNSFDQSTAAGRTESSSTAKAVVFGCDSSIPK